VAAVADVAFQAMHDEVHAAEASGFVGLLDAVDGQLRCGIHFMFRHESSRRDEHDARTARGIEDAPVIRLEHIGGEVLFGWGDPDHGVIGKR